MSLRYGNTNISNYQRENLRRAQAGNVGQVFEALASLVEDEDITDGEEDVLPEWQDIYENSKDRLARYMSPPLRERLSDLFSALSPIDVQCHSVDVTQQSICFLLGAGVSRPSPSDIPTVKELLPQLLDRARRLDREDVRQLVEYCESNSISNIEDILTAVQLANFASRNSVVYRLIDYLIYNRNSRDRYNSSTPNYARARRSSVETTNVTFLQDTLQILFGLLATTMLPAQPNPAHTAIADYCSKHPEAAIVTTNDDCLIDAALEHIDKPVDYYSSVQSASKNEDQASVRFLKLHGSLNWFYCETCQDVQVTPVSKIMSEFASGLLPYPVIGTCSHCGGQRRAMLVPPLATKFDIYPPLTPLLAEADKLFGAADLVVAVGFSFSDADQYLTRMISKAMQNNAGMNLLIVDPEFEISNSLRQRFTSLIPNFSKDRIMHISDDCAVRLPEFLRNAYYSSPTKKTSANGASGNNRRRRPRRQPAEST